MFVGEEFVDEATVGREEQVVGERAAIGVTQVPEPGRVDVRQVAGHHLSELDWIVHRLRHDSASSATGFETATSWSAIFSRRVRRYVGVRSMYQPTKSFMRSSNDMASTAL